jgi:hypothetical protein
MRSLVFGLLLATIGAAAGLQRAAAQDDMRGRLDQLERRVTPLEQRPPTVTQITQNQSAGGVLFLFGAFCALWAQNTQRNAWLWFFLGLCFSVITVLFLLSKNSEDRQRARKDAIFSEPGETGGFSAV